MINCTFCLDTGYAFATVDNKYREIQKCDECEVFESDEKAEKQAYKDGITTPEIWDKAYKEKLDIILGAVSQSVKL